MSTYGTKGDAATLKDISDISSERIKTLAKNFFSIKRSLL
jgi:hypothetical protein